LLGSADPVRRPRDFSTFRHLAGGEPFLPPWIIDVLNSGELVHDELARELGKLLA
jgi:hypothetical protein